MDHIENRYLDINRQSWNNRTEVHLHSDFYDLPGFMEGNSSLNEIELDLLGDLRGKTVLHLQCHFGQDSICLSRMGAQVTGVDLSDRAIESAKRIAKELGEDTKFICCDLYELENHLDGEFDVVFASYGTIGWLPDLDRWAKLIVKALRPGGKFVFVEFHPVVWMFDDHFDKVAYNYFNTGAIYETESGTYADRSAGISQDYVMWNHGLAEVICSLIGNGLQLGSFREYDYSPYNCFRGAVEIAPRKFRIAHLGDLIPMLYALQANKRVT